MAKQDKRKEKEKRDGAFLVRLAQDYEKPSTEHIKEREEAIRQQQEVKKRQEAIQKLREAKEAQTADKHVFYVQHNH